MNDINEHRYRNGDLNEQITNIKGQYESQIQEALAADNKEAANAYIEERDTKIEDVTNNFKSDDYVRPKVMKEKEQKIEDYYREMENYRPDFLLYKEAFKYYLKNIETGELYTNLNVQEGESPNDYINNKTMLFVKSYSMSGDFSNNNLILGYEALPASIILETKGTFEGRIGVVKSAPLSNPIMIEYQNYKQQQVILIVFTAASIGALLLCFYLLKKAKSIPAEIEKWRPYYNQLPIDARIVLFAIISFGALLHLFWVMDEVLYINENPIVAGRDLLISLLISSVFSGLALIQGKFLFAEFKDWPNIKKEWEKGLLNKAWQSMKDAFLIKSTGTQVFILFAMVFGFSLILAAVSIVAGLTIVHYYLMLLILIGLPVFIAMVKQIGYFNRIVQKTNELVMGNLGPDLPVSGKSVLATLAGNINVLKQGVKTSQNEQAKSERKYLFDRTEFAGIT